MTRKSAPLYLLFCVLSSYSAPNFSASADSQSSDDELFQLSLEELIAVNIEVITPSKAAEPLSQSPGIVSVFTDEEIALFGARDLGEVLSRITGIQPYDSLNSGRHRLTARGDQPSFNNNHVLMLLNGTPLNRESYAGGIWTQASLLTIPLPIIKRIEVSRGPGSVLYGTNAFAGVVNIITKESDELEQEVTVAFGSDNTKAVDVTYAHSAGDLKIAAAGRYFETDGWDFKTTTTGGDVFSDSADSKSPGFMATARYKDFYAATSYGKAEQFTIRGNPAAPIAGQTDNEKFFLDLGYEHTFENDWQVKTSASYVNGRTDHVVVQSGSLATIEYETDDARLELTSQGPLLDNFHLLLGGTVDYFSGEVPAPATFIPNWDEFLFGLYGQIEYRLEKTKFIAGAQYNKLESISGNLSPRFGVVHNFTNHFGFKALYGEAFRAPSNAERDLLANIGALTISGTPSLTPELVKTYDLQFFYEKEQLQASITWFKNEQEDLITRTFTSPTTIEFENKGGLDIEGVELESKFTFNEHWYFTGSYSYQYNEDSEDDTNVTLQPNSIIKLGLGYNTKDWSVGIFDSYFDSYHDNDKLNPSVNKVNPSSKGYHNLSINASVTLSNFYDVKLNAYMDNLLDEDVYLPTQPGSPFSSQNTLPSQSGRFFMFGISVPL